MSYDFNAYIILLFSQLQHTMYVGFLAWLGHFQVCLHDRLNKQTNINFSPPSMYYSHGEMFISFEI